MLNIVFAGTPEFAANILQGLIDNNINISACYSQPDRPKGRGRSLIATPVKQVATKHDIPVLQPENFKSSDAIEELRDLKPDLMIVVAYGLILPKAVLEIPTYGCINVHGSILPKYRGAAPVQHAILNGEIETGISIFQLDQGVDTGNILDTRKCSILEEDNSKSLLEKFIPLGVEGLLSVINQITTKSLKSQKQDDKLATFAPKIDKNAGYINWTKEDATSISRKVRAFNIWPNTYLVVNKESEEVRIKIIESHVYSNSSDQNQQNTEATPGTIISIDKKNILIKAKDSILAITKLQFPGSKILCASDVKNSPKYLSLLQALMP